MIILLRSDAVAVVDDDEDEDVDVDSIGHGGIPTVRREHEITRHY